MQIDPASDTFTLHDLLFDYARATLLAEQREPVLVEALSAAITIGWPPDRVRALIGLASHLPPDLLAQALTAASLAGRDAVIDVLPAVLSIEEGCDLLAAAVVSSLLRVQRWWP